MVLDQQPIEVHVGGHGDDPRHHRDTRGAEPAVVVAERFRRDRAAHRQEPDRRVLAHQLVNAGLVAEKAK